MWFKRSKYQLVQNQEEEHGDVDLSNAVGKGDALTAEEVRRKTIIRRASWISFTLTFIVFLLLYIFESPSISSEESCPDSYNGFNCLPEISHFWGQYSPFFPVPSEIPNVLPDGCNVTFVQILSRHGSRDPTFLKTLTYASLVERIKTNAHTFPTAYSFLKDFNYTLGSDQLTHFGQKELHYSGRKFYHRYEALAASSIPFVRAGGQERVVQSAMSFTQGFHMAKLEDTPNDDSDNYPYPILEIREDPESNNTLHHSLCNAFEEDDLGSDAQQVWLDIFAPPITDRVNRDLSGVNLTSMDTVHLMDLCPFHTVATESGSLSPFCSLFTELEWQQYDYFQSLGKYYGYANGNHLGPTQGVGFANELIARMTKSPVQDHTSVNQTLDSSNATFPLSSEVVLYADFSHDNDMTSIFAALGLYNSTKPLNKTAMHGPGDTNGYSASWTVPFSARAYFEKMQCNEYNEEMVRVLVNDRVIPLTNCGADALGRCTLPKFVDSLSFAREGGKWDSCFR